MTTGYKVNGRWLDFSGRIGLEMRSPLFDTDSIPGFLSYPAAFDDTPLNRQLLGFPAVRSRRVGPVPPVPAALYVAGRLWRVGLLRYQSYDSAKRQYNYQFEADADALAGQIDGVYLPTLPLGDLAFAGQVETADYVCLPVRNTAFYGEQNEDWGKVVNYVSPAGALLTNGSGGPHRYAFSPLLKLVPLLRRVLAHFGYTVTGDWLTDPEIQRLVVYHTRALDRPAGPLAAASVPVADLLPNIRVADLLLDLQRTFALAFVFHPTRKQVAVRALRDIVAAPGYVLRQPGASFVDRANDLDGFTLGWAADSGDELLKDFTWKDVVVGNGAEEIRPGADTLRMVREADPLTPGRQWLVPAAQQPARSPRADFGQTDTSPVSQLRLLFYRGLQPDSAGNLYPLGSSGTVNYAGQTVGQYALEWDGPQGLYQQWHRPWLDFRAAARIEERRPFVTAAELASLDPTVKELVGGLKFLWERVSIDVDPAGITAARFTYHRCSL